MQRLGVEDSVVPELCPAQLKQRGTRSYWGVFNHGVFSRLALTLDDSTGALDLNPLSLMAES